MTMNHHIAKVLYRIWQAEPKVLAVIGMARSRYCAANRAILRRIERTDDKRQCPHCGRLTKLVELEFLKTYCYSCSDWGMDPRTAVDE